MANNNLVKKKVEGKVAIVTGGASGIGEATARLMAEHGARAVVIADIQSEKGRAVAESIGPQRCSYVECDVADEEQVAAMIEWTATTYGGVDIMFSNAGLISGSGQSVLELDLAEWERVMRVNARGMAVCVKQAARKMVELGSRGAIICTSSVASRGAFHITDYTMSKCAVLGLMRSASMQLGAHGIRVNCVSPGGAVITPMTAKVGIATPADAEMAFGPFNSLKGVALTGELMAEAVLFLASDEAAFITGQDLAVDGGLVCMPFNLIK